MAWRRTVAVSQAWRCDATPSGIGVPSTRNQEATVAAAVVGGSPASVRQGPDFAVWKSRTADIRKT